MQRIDSATGEAFIDETCGTFGFKAPELKKGAYITTKVHIQGSFEGKIMKNILIFTVFLCCLTGWHMELRRDNV